LILRRLHDDIDVCIKSKSIDLSDAEAEAVVTSIICSVKNCTGFRKFQKVYLEQVGLVVVMAAAAAVMLLPCFQ